MPDPSNNDIIETQLVTLKGLNEVWKATKNLYQKSLTYVGGLYTPAYTDDQDVVHPATGLIKQDIDDVSDRIDDLSFESAVGADGSYISSINQEAGLVSAGITAFDDSISYSNPNSKNAPTSDAIIKFLKTITFRIENHSDFSSSPYNDSSPVDVTYNSSNNSVVLKLPKKVYGAAFN